MKKILLLLLFPITVFAQDTLRFKVDQNSIVTIVKIPEPPKPVPTYDEILDLSISSGFRDYRNKPVKPGYRIKVKGTLVGDLAFVGLYGTKDQPVIIDARGAVIKAKKNALWFRDNCAHIILIGGTYDASAASAGAQVVWLYGVKQTNITLRNIHVIGNPSSAAGVQVQSQKTTANNYSNWVFEDFKLINSLIENIGAEGIYINDSRDGMTNGIRPSGIKNLLIKNVVVRNTKWDGVQIAITKGMVVDSVSITHVATEKVSGQAYGFILNPGCEGQVSNVWIDGSYSGIYQNLGETGGTVSWDNIQVKNIEDQYGFTYNLVQNAERQLVGFFMRNSTIPGLTWFVNTNATTTTKVYGIFQNSVNTFKFQGIDGSTWPK